MNCRTAVMLIGVFQASATIRAQGPPPSVLGAVVRSSLPANPTGVHPTVPPTALIKNRARVLSDETTASGTRYFAVSERDVAGKSPSEVLGLLRPKTVQPDDGVRKMQVLVDLTRSRPMSISSKRGEPATVGTVFAEGHGLHRLDVESVIRTPRMTVVGR